MKANSRFSSTSGAAHRGYLAALLALAFIVTGWGVAYAAGPFIGTRRVLLGGQVAAAPAPPGTCTVNGKLDFRNACNTTLYMVILK